MQYLVMSVASAISLGACALITDLDALSQGTAAQPEQGGAGTGAGPVTAPASTGSGAPTAGAGGGEGGAGGDGSSAGAGGSPPCTGVHELELPSSDHCYRFDVTMTLGWNAAAAFCRDLGPGWDLCAVNDAAEHQLLQAVMAPSTQSELWIGGNDLTTEGAFEWHSGDPWTYDLWAADRPSNARCGSVGQDCVKLESALGDFRDDCCEEALPFLCERGTGGEN
jgi:hypothetical protein